MCSPLLKSLHVFDRLRRVTQKAKLLVMMRKVSAVVLFVDDLERCMAFYRDAVGVPVTGGDDASYYFRIEDQDFVLLKVSSAVNMISEEAVLPKGGAGHRVLLCVGVENVDAVYKTFTERGVTFIKPPTSQPWGRRTAYFADPEGNLWELWHSLPAEGEK
jgi:lactoylglutathione lyase